MRGLGGIFFAMLAMVRFAPVLWLVWDRGRVWDILGLSWGYWEKGSLKMG